MTSRTSDFMPPKGINFHLLEFVQLDELARALCRVAEFVQDNGYINDRLRRYDDWWQHDRLHFANGSIDIRGLFEIVKSPRAIYEAMPGDEYVRVGIAPWAGDWYLRFYATWDGEDRFLMGDFDITLRESLASRFREEVVRPLGLRVEEELADSYYQRIKA